jgi:hypothetical protein
VKRNTRVATALGTLAAVLAPGPAVAAPAYAAPPDDASSNDASSNDVTGRVTPVDWKPCPELPAADCGTVTVPVDWSKRQGATVDIALARQKATDPAARIGAILIDPGGPGGSGVEWVKNGPVFSAEVHRRFDVVGLPPHTARNAERGTRCSRRQLRNKHGKYCAELSPA